MAERQTTGCRHTSSTLWSAGRGCICFQEKHPQACNTETDLPNLASTDSFTSQIQAQRKWVRSHQATKYFQRPWLHCPAKC